MLHVGAPITEEAPYTVRYDVHVIAYIYVHSRKRRRRRREKAPSCNTGTTVQ